MNKQLLLLAFGFIAFGLAGCSGAKEQLGLERKPPDEFKVIKRAPLAMPPGYGLRPPTPGAPRPQEQSPDAQARETVLGTASGQTAQSGGESLLLQQAGAESADPAIRQKVDFETLEQQDRNKPVIQKLTGIGGGKDEIAATVVDAKAEAKRLKENAEAGKPVTEGETPSIED